MIHFITGKPGGGKGLVSMRLILAELQESSRPILTNLAVELNPWVTADGRPMLGLLAYLRKKFGKTFGAEKRVFRLNDDQAAEFFLWRAVENGSGVLTLDRAKANLVGREDSQKIMDFDVGLLEKGPHFYVIDEAWKFWGSRNWQKTGEGVLFYNSQHRKAGDDVLIVTQHTKQIDPAVQRVAQDFWVCKNRSLLRIGLFRQPDDFVIQIFDQPPTGGAMQKPMSKEKFRLDKAGLAQTYDTTAGVGLSGRMLGDASKKKKGVPFSWLWGLGLAVPVVIFLGINYGMKFVNKRVAVGSNAVGAAISNFVASPKALPGVGQVGPVPAETNAFRRIPPEVQLTGYVWLDGAFRVCLSDGTIEDSRDKRLQFLCNRYCVIAGVTNWARWAATPRGESPFNGRVSSVEFPASSGGPGPSSVVVIGQREEQPRYRMDRSLPGSAGSRSSF